LLSPIWVIEKRKKDVSFIDQAIVETWTDQVLTSLMVKEVFFRGKSFEDATNFLGVYPYACWRVIATPLSDLALFFAYKKNIKGLLPCFSFVHGFDERCESENGQVVPR
jgi:hypothetical protein